MADDPKVLESEKKPPSAVSMALDNFPKEERILRNEFVEHFDALKKESKEASSKLTAHKKRRTEIFNCDPAAGDIFDKLRGLTQERRDVVLTQVAFLLSTLQLIGQQDLFHNIGEAGGLTKEKDEGSVFDKTGNKAAPKSSEREPVKKLTGAEPPPHVPTPGIPLDKALEGFKDANDKKAARAGATPKPPSAQKGASSVDKGAQGDAVANADPAPKKPAATPVPPVPASRSASATAKASQRRMSRAPTKSEAKAIADGYFNKPGEAAKPKDDGEEGEKPGTYQVH